MRVDQELLAHLERNVAASEREILEIADLIAPTMVQAGISERNTLVIAATFACGATQLAAAEVLIDLLESSEVLV